MIFIGVIMTIPNGKRMNHDTATDFEINKQVAKELGHEFCVSHHPKSENAIIILSQRPDPVDYCNNPADSWPIIAGNGINFIFQKDALSNVVGSVCRLSSFWGESSNPLRAAMIVFLKMKDAEK